MQPLRSGFRAVFRQPALILAEIAWRWSFGAAAWVLVVLAIRRVLAGIDISEAEYLLARRSDVFLIADACARIISQVLPALARAATIVIPALLLIWIFAATLGRAATVRTLLSASVILSNDAARGERAGIAREHAASESKDPDSSERGKEFVGPGTSADAAPNIPEGSVTAAARGRRNLTSLLLLNFLRALFTLATLLAFVGSMILAGIAFPARGADPTTAVVIWIILATLVTFFWSVINWLLALAPIWIVRDGRGPLPAVAESLALFHRQPAAYLGAAGWFGLVRALLLLAALLNALFAASALDSARAVAAVSVLLALLYFALADFLYIARLGAYTALANESPQSSAVSLHPLSPVPQSFQ